MKLTQILVAAACAVAASSAFADTFSEVLDLTGGTAYFGRTPAAGSFLDTYTFNITEPSTLLAGSASSAAVGGKDLTFTSLVIEDAANMVIANYTGTSGGVNVNEFFSLSSMPIGAGLYHLIITGSNSLDMASYSGNISVVTSPVPEPEALAMMLAGVGVLGFVSRRRTAPRAT